MKKIDRLYYQKTVERKEMQRPKLRRLTDQEYLELWNGVLPKEDKEGGKEE